MKQITSKILCKDMKGIGATDTFAVGTCDGLSIQIIGDAPNFNVEFECSLDGLNWGSPIEGFFASDQSTFATSTTKLNEVLTFDVSAIIHFRCNVVSNNSEKGVTIFAVNFID